MTQQTSPVRLDLNIGDKLCGYGVKKTAELKEIQSFFYELEHEATGAKHIHIANGDKENTFGVAFKTIPMDSTGVAHILEHTVLCGSKKFPVRDPFFSMLKRSLSTFMNAFTASDWTMYPFSTQNKKDYFNLMDVYLDAAFFPRIDALSFKQEGHRLEIEKEGKERRLVYKGVVYNEMKGAMSSPDQVMVRSLLNALYPETTYSNNSGGDPAVIPSLTHEQLKAFHSHHYHPSNAFFYTYGDLALDERLDFISKKVLNHFERIDPKTDVPQQPRWNAPKTATYHYPLSKNEAPDKKHQVCVAWLTADIKDTFEVLVLAVLEQVLLGNPASPLRKALMDSQIGTALSDGTGFDSENRDTLFACGLKDVTADSAGKIETIIFDVLKGLVKKGIDKTLVESAIHQIEFHRKEITNTPYPYGLKLLLNISGSWFHHGDPDRILLLDREFTKLRKFVEGGPFLEDRIKRWFIENPHRVLFTLKPDQEMEQKEQKSVEKALLVIKNNLTMGEMEQIQKDTDALEAMQDSEENVSCLPTLSLGEIPITVSGALPSEALSTPSVDCYDQPTSGIFYFSGALGAGDISRHLLPLAPFFSYAFTKSGTTTKDYMELARDIDLYTGGIGLAANARTGYDGNGNCLPFLSFNGKCLTRNLEPMFDIISDLSSNCRFTDLSRLKQLVLEYRAGLESMIVHNGHRLAISLSSRGFSKTTTLSEIWTGVHQLKTIKQLTDDLTDEKLNVLSESLMQILRSTFANNNFKIALVGSEDGIAKARVPVKSILRGLKKQGENGFHTPDLDVAKPPSKEGWSTSTAVSFVAQTFEAVRMGHADAPALSVISKILRSMYLHREIREKGGAYGGFAIYNSEEGLFSFGSYRDPHIKATLDVYEQATDFIHSGNFDDEDVKEAILQVCSEIDKPDPPGPMARKAFYRKLISLTDEDRLKFKKGLISLSKKEVLKTARKYFHHDKGKKAVAVISGKDRLEEANLTMKAEPFDLHEI